MFDVSPEGANLWFDISNLVLLAGAVLVALGTYGTIKFSGIKEKFSDERISINEVETKRAVAESDKANATLGTAQADIAKANAQIAAANERAAGLERDTAQARAEQERLRAQLAWRRLTPNQSNQIASAARGVQLATPLNVVAPTGDVEAATYAMDIIAALKAGGIAVRGDIPSSAIYMPLPPFGLVVRQASTEQVASPIAHVLASAGLQLTVETGAPEPELTLIVGTKPQ